MVGHDGGSETYVAHKVKACEQCGFKSTLIRHEDDITEEELLKEVERLNDDADIDAFIVQLPLPKHISEQRIIEAIDYRKDVDGFHPINVGRMSIGLPCFVSATPAGIMELLKRYDIDTKGKHCVVLGRSNIVGKPVATLMMQKSNPGNATVTVCHSASKNLKEMCRQADIIIAALGQPNFNTCTGRIEKIGFPTQWRCSLRGSSPQMFLHHSRPRRCRPYDHRIAHAQYPVGRQKSHLQITSRV